MFSSPKAEDFIIQSWSVENYTLLGIISIPWPKQTLVPAAGISQVIVRENSPLCSIGPTFKGTIPRLYQGDAIYHVSLAPYIFSFDGVITTIDNRQRNYSFQGEFRVSNPTCFISKYLDLDGPDPAQRTYTQLKETFEYYCSKLSDPSKENIRLWLDRHMTTINQACGIQLTNPAWFFHAAHTTKSVSREESMKWEIEQKKQDLAADYELRTYEEELKLGMDEALERRRTDFHREQSSKHNDFSRQEKMKKQILAEQINLLSNIVTGAIRINNDRINDSLDYNNPTHQVLEDSLKLLGVLNNASISSSEQQEIVDAVRASGMLPDESPGSGPNTTINPTIPSTNGTLFSSEK